MKYKFRIREDQPNGLGLKPFRVEYQSKGRDDWSWSDWTRYVGYRGDEAEFDTLDEAKSFISNEIKLMADAEPKYHYL